MISYIGLAGKHSFHGSYCDCEKWARELVAGNHTRIPKIFRIRAGESECVIVAEVSDEGVRVIRCGRYLKKSNLKRICPTAFSGRD
jgi:hypothetical protein